MRTFSYLFIIALLTIAVSTMGFAQHHEEKHETKATALMFTLSGLSEISVGNIFGGIGVQHYFTNDISGRFSVGGTFADGVVADYSLSGTALYDFMRFGQGAFYAGVGVAYTHPSGVEDNYGITLPLGASFEIFDNVTLGAEYITTVELDPTVVTVGGTSGAKGLLAIWF